MPSTSDGSRKSPEHVPDVRDLEQPDDQRADGEQRDRPQHRERALALGRVLGRDARGILARGAAEDAEHHAAGIERGQQRSEQPQAPDEVADRAALGECVREYLVLREEAREGRDADQRQRADPHQERGERKEARHAAHAVDVLLVVERVDHDAGAEEQEGLEERVRDEMEHARRVRADADRGEHVADLGHRRVRDDAFDVGLHERDQARHHERRDADHGHEVGRPRERARRSATCGRSGRRRR